MFLRLLVLISFWCNAIGTLDLIREGLVEMTNDLPHRAIEDIVSKHQEMIEIIHTYKTLTLSFQEEYFFKEERASPSKKEDHQIEQVNIDVHNDVIFVGFPATAVESVRSRWFEPLTHEDHIMASVGSESHVVVVPGQLKYLNHFHIPQISFHVADSIKEYIVKLLLRSEDGDESYINSWELEEILEDLVGVINVTHNLEWKTTAGPDSTLFILNINPSTAEKNISYSYRNGFSAKDLAVMASDPEVQTLIVKLLDANRSTRIDLPADQAFPLFDSESNKDKYQNRFSVDSGTSNGKVHWRDAVAATRDWAQGLRDKMTQLTNKFSLRERALRILNAASETPLGTHKMALALALRRQLMNPTAPEKVECSPSTLVGGGRVMFRDLHTLTSPPTHRTLGNTPSSPHPRPLTEEDWVGLGLLSPSKDKTVRVGAANLVIAADALTRHINSLNTLSEQSGCISTFHKDPVDQGPGAGMKRLRDVSEGLYRQVVNKDTSSICAGLAFQTALTEILKEVSDQTRAMAQVWRESPSGPDLKLHIDDAEGFLSRILEEAMETSNPLLSASSTQLHAGRISEEAGVYLAHLTSYVLQTVRYRVTQPMALRIDRSEGFHEHHHSDNKEGGRSISGLTPITEAVRRRIEDATRDLENLQFETERTMKRASKVGAKVSNQDDEEDGDFEDFEERQYAVGSIRGHHVYTGESLLEMVLADHHFKYNHDKYLISGAQSRGEHKSTGNAHTLPVWRSLLPSVIVPSKIDIVIYIVSLQSTYNPKAASIGDNLGFDFTTFLNEIPRLKLPNQQMTINIQTVDKASIVSEKGIGLGLSSCKREGIVPSSTSIKPSPEFYHFYDQACVWSHLHPYDDKNILSNKFKIKKKLSASTQHVPIFLISVDTQIPTLLADMHPAAVVGDMVIIMQNKQMEVASELSCYPRENTGRPLTVNQGSSGRNPLAAALAAVAEVIGGLPRAQSGHRGLPTAPTITAALQSNAVQSSDEEAITGYEDWAVNRHSWMRNDLFGDNKRALKTGGHILKDYSSYLGDSPLFEANALSSTTLPRYSTLDTDTLHRSRILRSVSMTRATEAQLAEHTFGLYDEKIDEDLNTVNNLIIQALSASDSSDWAAGTAYANSAYIKCMHLNSHVLSHIHDTVVTAATTSMDSHNNTYVKESIVRNLVEETDLGDEDSFAYFYTKFLFVCGSLFIACFNAMKKTIRYYKNRRILM